MLRITSAVIGIFLLVFIGLGCEGQPEGGNLASGNKTEESQGIRPAAKIAEGVDLAKLDGWDIVVADDAIASEEYAAEEFQEFFRQASGVKLPIVHETDRPDRHIFIGPSQAMRSSDVGFGIEDFEAEDLRIVVRDGNIAIAGGRPRGTLYGVYTFLEDYLGVRFLTHDHTHVPAVGDWRVVGPVDRFYHPPLCFRWSAYGETDNSIFVKPEDGGSNTPHFAARLRCNTVNKTSQAKFGWNRDPKYGGATDRILINHSFYALLGEEYEKDHPEYFAMINGKRHADHFHSQPCLTNPDVLRIVTEAVLKEIEDNPDRKYFTVVQNDNYKYCRCPACAAIDEREGTHMGALLEFVNAVAEEVAKKHPDVKIGTAAYQYSRKPPKTIKPHPNVQIQLCSIECSMLQPINDPNSRLNASFRNELAQWSQICDDINIWSYNTNFHNYLLPCPNLRVLEPNIRHFVANRARGVFMQGPHNALGAEFSDLRNYVTSRLLWDPNQSGETLINEFLRLHYGKAARPIRRFITLVHDNVAAKGIEQRCVGDAKSYGLDENIVQAGLEAFDEALRLAEDDTVRDRVEKASVCIYRLAIEDAWMWTQKNRKKLDRIKMPPDLAQRSRPYTRRLFELIDKHNVTRWSEGTPPAIASDILRRGYGLKKGEGF